MEELVHDKLHDTWSFRGVSMGRLQCLGENEEMRLLAMHEGGHSYFGGQGRPSQYAPSRIIIYRYREKIDRPDGEEAIYEVTQAKGDLAFSGRPPIVYRGRK